jgi:hypothetical protein
MDKLYTLPFSENIPSPSKETLQFILQYAAAYGTIELCKLPKDYISN